jgi:hypothetical protein
VLAKIADVIEMAGLRVGVRGADVGQGRLVENPGGDVLDRASWMNLIFLYSPDAIREMTSRLVISGSTMVSRPRRP